MGISPLSLRDIPPFLGKGGKKQLHADWHGAVGESLRHGFAVPPPFRQGRLFAGEQCSPLLCQ